MDFGSAIYNHFQFFWKILKLKQILNFLKNGPWPYFRDNSYEIYYISLIEFSWVWAWSPNFNFFSNKKGGVSHAVILNIFFLFQMLIRQVWWFQIRTLIMKKRLFLMTISTEKLAWTGVRTLANETALTQVILNPEPRN